MAPEKEYIRLPGRRRLTLGFSRTSLWLGKDHVLHVINRGYTEEYRRFFYGDIQAILMRKTVSGTVINIILGIIAGLSLLFLALGWFVLQWETFALIPLAIASFLWLIIFLFCVTAGPTCVCHLRTAVQFEPLPSLFRVRTAHKAIALLRQRAEAVQGRLASEPPPPQLNTEEFG
jgi:hypothetical protein